MRSFYQNPYIDNVKRRFWDFILWKIGYYRDGQSKRFPPQSFQYPLHQSSHDPQKSSAVWIGHSTFFIQSQGISLLTDPIWNSRCSPVSFIGPKRRHQAPFAIDTLPSVDFVLISHNHYDHLDRSTVLKLTRLYEGITWIVPLGVKKWFEKLGIANVYELNWWDILEFRKEQIAIQITATPSQHFSGRVFWDLNQSFWNGYVVKIHGKEVKSLYFVGDTGYNEKDFKQIGERCAPIDLSLIPIGTYSPREFMKTVHICPKEAVQIHREVRSKLSIGMHWKTFHLSDEPLNLPPYDLYLSMKEAGLPHEEFLALDPGIYVNW